MAARPARASATPTAADVTALACVAQFLFGAEAIESRALALPLARAQHLDEARHLLRVGLGRRQAALFCD